MLKNTILIFAFTDLYHSINNPTQNSVLYGACYQNSDTTNKLVSVKNGLTLTIDGIFENKNVNEICCLWYTNKNIAEKTIQQTLMTSNELLNRISTNNIQVLNGNELDISCNDIKIHVSSSKKKIKSEHVCINDSPNEQILLSETNISNHSHIGHKLPSWILPFVSVLIGILVFSATVISVLYAKQNKKTTLIDKNEGNHMKIDNRMIDINIKQDVPKYTIGDDDEDDIDNSDWTDSTSSPIKLGRINNVILNKDIIKLSDNIISSIKSHKQLPKIDLSKIRISVSSSDDADDENENENDIPHESQLNTKSDKTEANNEPTADLP